MLSNESASLESVNCALCEQDNAELVLTSKDWLHHQPGEFRLVRCRQCGLVYVNPRPTRDSILKYYPADYEYAPTSAVSHRRKTWRQQLLQTILTRDYGYALPAARLPLGARPWVKLYHAFYKTIALPIFPWRPNGRLLDVGCGKGDYLAEQRRLGWQGAGIEINPFAVQYARGHLDLDVFEGDFASWDLPSASFDIVTMWWYLEHVADPVRVLELARHVLKPNGLLALGVPNWASLDAKIFGRAWYHLDTPRHLYMFTPTTLQALLRRAGFRTVFLRSASWLNDPAESVERWIELHSGARRTLPRMARLMLAPWGWLAARVQRGDLLFALANP